jgi:hypothetical protein
MKRIIAVIASILLFAISAPLFADGEHGTTTVNISGGSTSFFDATGAMAKGATANTLDLNAAIYKDGNGVEAATSGLTKTFAVGSGNVNGQSGVVGAIAEKLSANHVLGEAGTAQLAQVGGTGITQSGTMVMGKTLLNAWIDPIHVQGNVTAFSFDKAMDPLLSTGQNGGKVWLDMAIGH